MTRIDNAETRRNKLRVAIVAKLVEVKTPVTVIELFVHLGDKFRRITHMGELLTELIREGYVVRTSDNPPAYSARENALQDVAVASLPKRDPVREAHEHDVRESMRNQRARRRSDHPQLEGADLDTDS